MAAERVYQTEVLDPLSHIESASPGKLAGVMGLGESPARAWRPEELAAVFKHQMAAPICVDLAGLGSGTAARVRTLTDATGLLLKSFEDLFLHPNPPLELLVLVKEFGKRNRAGAGSVIPHELATMLYYLSIAAAMVRWGERISSLSAEEVGRGLEWCCGQAWIDSRSRELLRAARERVA
jgi:hypothetical protein